MFLTTALGRSIFLTTGLKRTLLTNTLGITLLTTAMEKRTSPNTVLDRTHFSLRPFEETPLWHLKRMLMKFIVEIFLSKWIEKIRKGGGGVH